MAKNQDETLWFVCKFCKRAFNRRKYLLRHKRQFHPQVSQNSQHSGVSSVENSSSGDKSQPKPKMNNSDDDDEVDTKLDCSSKDKKSPTKINMGSSEVKKLLFNKLLTKNKDKMEAKTMPKIDSTIIIDRMTPLSSGEAVPVFTTRDDVVGHFIPNGRGQKAYSCLKCDKVFQQSYHLLRHQTFHTGQLPFPCKFCDKAYTFMRDLTEHLRTEHKFLATTSRKSNNFSSQPENPSKKKENCGQKKSERNLNQMKRRRRSTQKSSSKKESPDQFSKSRSSADKKLGTKSAQKLLLTKEVFLECMFCDENIPENSLEEHERTHVSGKIM